ncbi:MAG TPA: ABC transporter substrate-binding protein, partial [Acidimicrobiales bacterium]|nr:ABC transporter substrate-binding protein [Acidimicrobiales bacterium]
MHETAQQRAPWRRLLAILAAGSLLAMGCGGGDDDEGADDEPGGGSETTEPGNLEPQPGGTLVYGLEADTSTPWTPQNSVCAISCHMIMRTVYDTLTLPNEDAEYVPYLAESVTPNDDFTEWTITPRQGVTFHDGTPFDAAAICFNITAHLSSVLTGKALLNVNGGPDDPGGPGPQVSADGSSCVVPMKEPWTHFPVYLSGQIGYMASPTWLQAVEAGTADAAAPVGTGPFVFDSYEPGGSFVATKNADYWRAAEGLPYLDRVEMRVFVDVQSRVNALLDGTIDMMHLANGEFIADLRDEDSIVLEETSEYGETGYLLINQRDPVMSDIRVRRALAMATDNQVLSEDREAGVEPPANGPYSPSQVGYLEDTGYPEFDLQGAIDLVNEYEEENGPLSITFNTTNDPYNRETNELIAANWQAAGIDVTINTVEQGQYILDALQGNFQVFGWRNHGGVDPDSQRIWWHSETGDAATNPLALNFGGIDDPDLDAQLE